MLTLNQLRSQIQNDKNIKQQNIQQQLNCLPKLLIQWIQTLILNPNIINFIKDTSKTQCLFKQKIYERSYQTLARGYYNENIIYSPNIPSYSIVNSNSPPQLFEMLTWVDIYQYLKSHKIYYIETNPLHKLYGAKIKIKTQMYEDHNDCKSILNTLFEQVTQSQYIIVNLYVDRHYTINDINNQCCTIC